MSVDLVCGMMVDEKKAAATSDYQGQKYYFCAVGCKKAFDQTPRNTSLNFEPIADSGSTL